MGGNDLDPASEQVLAIAAQVHEMVEGSRAGCELDEQVDIAIGPCLVPLERAEKTEPLDIEGADGLLALMD